MRILALDNCIFTQREMCYMSKTYLFSPIGNTDPIKYFYDGSMLHICRYYKPDVVILYLSHEMILHHEKDNRYVRSIELLGEKLGHTFEVRIIRDEQMVDVQQYDLFYHAFRGIIADIEEEMMPEDTLIGNTGHEKRTAGDGNPCGISIFADSGIDTEAAQQSGT